MTYVLSRIRMLGLMIGLCGLTLVGCKIEDEPGYMVHVLLMLSPTLSPTTTVNIWENGADRSSEIKDATVTMRLNDSAPTVVPYVDSFGHLLNGNISGVTPKAGDMVTASISFGGKQIGESVRVPAGLKVTGPSTTQDASQAITLTWDSPTVASDEIQIVIVDEYTAANDPIPFFADITGTSGSYAIPARTLKAGLQDAYVSVTAENTRALTGPDLEPHSWFTISSSGGISFDTF